LDGRQAAGGASRKKNDWIVQVIPQQAIKAIPPGALYSKNSDPAAGVGMALFTTTLGLYGGVLWSGELQGFIIHEAVHITKKLLN
jgi:hypothetical protein